MALTDADLTMLSDRGVWSNAAPHFADAGLEMIRAEIIKGPEGKNS
jgi:hypothetical protein